MSRATVYDLIARGQLPCVKLQGRAGRLLLRVPVDGLRKLIEDRSK